MPDDCGKYKVSVKYGDQEVAQVPFPVQAYATGKVGVGVGVGVGLCICVCMCVCVCVCIGVFFSFCLK